MNDHAVKIIDAAMLDGLMEKAAATPRRRLNLNFHATPDAACQRLLNAVHAGSYVRPHRHLDPAKDEFFAVMRGRLGVVLFDDAGRVTRIAVLSAAGPAMAIEIPPGTYHTLVPLDDGCIIFETKAGPYRPHAPEELAAFAPAEGSPEAPAYFAGLLQQVRAAAQ